MTITLVLPSTLGERLHEVASQLVETGAVLLVRPVHTPSGSLRLLGVELHEVPETAYVRREVDELLIRSEGYVPALGRAAEIGAVPIWVHTHPGDGSSLRASSHDHEVDRLLTDVFRIRASSSYYGALIVGVEGADLRFSGHVDDGLDHFMIDRLWIVGARFALYSKFRDCENYSASSV